MPHALTRAISAARVILLTTPDLDGDAVGAIVALARAITLRWPGRRIIIGVDEPLPLRYQSLADPELFRVAPALPDAPIDLALVLDGDPSRLRAVAPFYKSARLRGLVDHHKSSVHADVDIGFLDPQCSSTAEMVLRLCDHWGVPLDRELARGIWAGMTFDTSVFRYRLTRPATLRAAARLLETGIDHARIVEQVLLSQSPEKVKLRGVMINRMQIEADGQLAWAALDAQTVDGSETGGLVDDLVFVEGVQIGALIVDKGDGRIKLSLRSRGAVDVAALARGLSPKGGGHARAAGATLPGPLEAATRMVVTAARSALSGAPI